MKKIVLTIALMAAFVNVAQAQWMRVWQGEETTRYSMSDYPTIPYDAAGSTLTFGEDSYSTAEIDSITIINPVTISWTNEGASVDIPEGVEGVSATLDGGNVIINNVNTWSEQEFILQGSSSAGSLVYRGAFKTKFHLNGVHLTSVDSAAIDIECGKRIDVILEAGTENSFADPSTRPNVTDDETTNGERAAVYCKGHMEISGGGSLTITGNYKHALVTKEYLFLKRTVGSVTIAKSVADGIHCGEYFKMNGGALVLKNIGGDGIQVETKDKDKTEEELNGQFIMNGGSIDLTMSAPSTKGIRLDDDAYTELVDGKMVEHKATVVPEMYINDGTITVNLTAKALGAKAIASDGNFTIGTSETSPTINIDLYADWDTNEERATGLKATSTLLIAGGTTVVNAIGDNARGVRAYKLRATGGSLTVTNTGDDSQGIKLDSIFISEGGTVKGKFRYK